MLHFVYFDGTSAWTGDASDATSETEVLFKSTDVEECFNFEDEYNEHV